MGTTTESYCSSETPVVPHSYPPTSFLVRLSHSSEEDGTDEVRRRKYGSY